MKNMEFESGEDSRSGDSRSEGFQEKIGCQKDIFVEDARNLSERLIGWRRQIHRNPELSGQEHHTALLVAGILRENGCEVQEGIGGYGLTGEVRGAYPGKTIAFRADMDALPIQEETGRAYASEIPGVMHACGHDIHTAALLGAAVILAGHRAELAGTFKFIFQPREEDAPRGGARDMIRMGVLDGVDAVFCFHVWPGLPHGTVGVRPGVMMAASDHFSIRIHGKASHGAQPDQGIDALLLGTQVIQQIQYIISRELDPLDTAVITIGRMEAGTRYNILAEDCMLEGTCRTARKEVRDQIERRLGGIVEYVCAEAGAKGTLIYERGYSAVINRPEMAEAVKRSARRLFSEQAVAKVEHSSMCADDFAFYLEQKPGAYFYLGVGQGENSSPLHNPGFDVDEDILWRGAALICEILTDAARGRRL